MNKEKIQLELSEFLPYRLNLISQRISSSLSNIYTEFGITIPQWRILVWLNTKSNLYAKDICRYTYMDKTQVSRLINQLEERDLLARHIDNKDQRRAKLALTAKGQQLIEEIIPKALDWEKVLVSSITDKEYQDLIRIFAKLENQITLDS